MKTIIKSGDVYCGVYHELPDGRIAYTFGANSIDKEVRYYFDDDFGERKVSYDEYYTWKLRRDLGDFPNAKDPKVPYDFDLWWDIKYKSELVMVFAGIWPHHIGDKGIKFMKKLMKSHNIVITKDEIKRAKEEYEKELNREDNEMNDKYSMKCAYCTSWTHIPGTEDRGNCSTYNNKEIGGMFWCREHYEIDYTKTVGLEGVPENPKAHLL